MRKIVKKALPDIRWMVWLRSRHHSNVLYFLGIVEGIQEDAIEEALKIWPQFKGQMKLEMSKRTIHALEALGLLDKFS